MSNHMPSRNPMRRLCVELTEGDGLDPKKSLPGRPRRHSGHGASRGRDDRKSLQLCHQISQTLDEVFADCRDDILRGLSVVAVEPAPDATRLLVTVIPDGGFTPDGPDPAAIVDHLTRAAGYLRARSPPPLRGSGPPCSRIGWRRWSRRPEARGANGAFESLTDQAIETLPGRSGPSDSSISIERSRNRGW